MTTRLLLVVTVGLVPGIAVAQGLGGVARQEADRRERQQAVGGEAHTYSDADLRSNPGDGGSDAVATSDGVTGMTDAILEASDPASDAAGNQDDADRLREKLDRAAARRKAEERKWRQRVGEARARLATARKEHDAVCKTGGFFVSGG